ARAFARGCLRVQFFTCSQPLRRLTGMVAPDSQRSTGSTVRSAGAMGAVANFGRPPAACLRSSPQLGHAASPDFEFAASNHSNPHNGQDRDAVPTNARVCAMGWLITVLLAGVSNMGGAH